MIRKKTIISSLALSVGLLVGTGAYSFAANVQNEDTASGNSASEQTNGPVDKGYKINSKGETYGSGLWAESIEDMPDLLRARGDHGIEGYIYLTDMLGEQPASPEEAIRMQEERIASGNTAVVINVYDCEGEEILDTQTAG